MTPDREAEIRQAYGEMAEDYACLPVYEQRYLLAIRDLLAALTALSTGARRGEPTCHGCQQGECPTHLGTPSHLGSTGARQETKA